jgi:hypothetical protein
LSVVVVLGFGGWDVAAVLGQAAVVEPVDPFGGGVFDGVQGVPGAAGFDELGLVKPVDGLGQGVVVAVAVVPTEAATPAWARRSV